MFVFFANIILLLDFFEVCCTIDLQSLLYLEILLSGCYFPGFSPFCCTIDLTCPVVLSCCPAYFEPCCIVDLVI